MGEPVVLTSENSAEFYARKLNLVPEPAAASAPAKAGTGEPAVESATEASTAAASPTEGADEQQPSSDTAEGKQRLNARFSELTERSKTAEAKALAAQAEAKVERDARALAEKRAQEAEAKLKPAPTPEMIEELDPKPLSSQFTDAFEYAEALAEWSADKALHERDKKDAEKQSIAAREAVTKRWVERQNAVKAEVPDYETVIAASQVQVSDQARDAIMESEVGPKILLHLAKNPDVAAKLGTLSVGGMLREIGKLEAKLESASPPPATKVEATPAQEPAAVVSSEPSRAPAPINPIKGGGAAVEPLVDDKGVFHGTHAQWKAARKAGKI